jgi:hypothetical protein
MEIGAARLLHAHLNRFYAPSGFDPIYWLQRLLGRTLMHHFNCSALDSLKIYVLLFWNEEYGELPRKAWTVGLAIVYTQTEAVGTERQRHNI